MSCFIRFYSSFPNNSFVIGGCIFLSSSFLPFGICPFGLLLGNNTKFVSSLVCVWGCTRNSRPVLGWGIRFTSYCDPIWATVIFNNGGGGLEDESLHRLSSLAIGLITLHYNKAPAKHIIPLGCCIVGVRNKNLGSCLIISLIRAKLSAWGRCSTFSQGVRI